MAATVSPITVPFPVRRGPGAPEATSAGWRPVVPAPPPDPREQPTVIARVYFDRHGRARARRVTR